MVKLDTERLLGFRLSSVGPSSKLGRKIGPPREAVLGICHGAKLGRKGGGGLNGD